MNTVACSVCKQEKPRSKEFFYAFRTSRDGLSPRCITCDKAISARLRKNNRDKAAQTAKEWREKYPDRNRRNIEDWRARNPEKVLTTVKVYSDANAAKRREYMVAWRKNNPDKMREGGRGRREAVDRATPSWLTDEEVSEIRRAYLLRAKLAQQTGTPHEVDHIVPLRNKLVCGLHVPWNLRVVPKAINQQKRNRLEDLHGEA